MSRRSLTFCTAGAYLALVQLGCGSSSVPDDEAKANDASSTDRESSGGAGTQGQGGLGAGGGSAGSGASGSATTGSAGDATAGRGGSGGKSGGGTGGSTMVIDGGGDVDASAIGADGGGDVDASAIGSDGSGDADSSAIGADGGGESGADGGPTGVVAGGVRWVGRMDATNQTAIKFNWSGSGFIANVSATGASVAVTMNNDTAVYFQPVVDSVPGVRVKAAQGMSSVLLANSLPAGMHTVELYRDTEASVGGVSTFMGITGATLLSPPTYSGRLIEVIGESISNGYGELGNETHANFCASTVNPCGYTIDTQSAYLTYGAVTARNLNADWSIIANSGWGLYRDLINGLQNVMPKVYNEAYYTGFTPPQWGFGIKAQAVIINLGTNDLAKGDPGVAYKDALKNFVGQIRSKHGQDAWIFPVTGPLLGGASIAVLAGYINTAIAELADPKVFYVNLATQDCNQPTGCEWHPSVAEHQRLANILVPILKSKLGW